MQRWLAIAVGVAGCASAPPRPPAVVGASPYAGRTTCGAPVPAAPPHGFAAEPAIEPMPWSAPTAAPAPPPRPPLGPTSFSLDAALADRAWRLRACAAHYHAQTGDAGALHVTARFALGADGRVAGVEVDGVDRELDRCVCESIAAMSVRDPGGGGVISYPLIFD